MQDEPNQMLSAEDVAYYIALGEFWDTHSSADFQWEEVHFEVHIKRQRRPARTEQNEHDKRNSPDN